MAPTEHEIAVLRAWIDCGSAKQAAERLGISHRTVQRHLENLRRKTGCHHTSLVAAMAFENGWFMKLDSPCQKMGILTLDVV
jgi:DNA-binding NarL/FixJ family response regulator